MFCKNVKDQKSSVHYLTFQLMLQIVHLCRGKFIVTDNSCSIRGQHKSTYLLDLSFANISSRMYSLTVLDNFSHCLGSGSICKLLQFIQGFFHIVVLVQLNANQNHLLLYFFNIFHKSSFRIIHKLTFSYFSI